MDAKKDKMDAEELRKRVAAYREFQEAEKIRHEAQKAESENARIANERAAKANAEETPTHAFLAKVPGVNRIPEITENRGERYARKSLERQQYNSVLDLRQKELQNERIEAENAKIRAEADAERIKARGANAPRVAFYAPNTKALVGTPSPNIQGFTAMPAPNQVAFTPQAKTPTSGNALQDLGGTYKEVPISAQPAVQVPNDEVLLKKIGGEIRQRG